MLLGVVKKMRILPTTERIVYQDSTRLPPRLIYWDFTDILLTQTVSGDNHRSGGTEAGAAVVSDRVDGHGFEEFVKLEEDVVDHVAGKRKHSLSIGVDRDYWKEVWSYAIRCLQMLAFR